MTQLSQDFQESEKQRSLGFPPKCVELCILYKQAPEAQWA